MEWKTLLSIAIICTLFVLIQAPSSVSAQPPTDDIYYENASLSYTIKENKSVNVKMKFTFVNHSKNVKILDYEDPRRIPATELHNIDIYASSGVELDYTTEKVSERLSEIKVQYNRDIAPGEELTYFIELTASDMLSRQGPEYRSKFGKTYLIRDYPYENYEVKVQADPNSQLQLFSHDPANIKILGENMRYGTRLDASQTFEGIQGTWYQSPAYFEVTLNEILQNQGTEEIKNTNYELILFNQEEKWQFPALLKTPPTLKGLYPREENNWRGFIEVSFLPAEESKEIEFKLIHELQVYDPDLSPSDVGNLSEVPENLDPYLENRDYWPANKPVMKNASEAAVNGETNAYSVAKNIVKFVNGRLQYEVQAERLGALQAYQIGAGDCSEYTDLSITLARAAGLPARASYGWAYRDNGLIGHVWPEFYFPGVGWEPADPTWMDTGGIISPGGLRPSPQPPGKGPRKTASAPANSYRTYLSRLDRLHLQRNI